MAKAAVAFNNVATLPSELAWLRPFGGVNCRWRFPLPGVDAALAIQTESDSEPLFEMSEEDGEDDESVMVA